MPELLQEQLFEVADIVLLVEQDDSFLVFDFVHASVGEGTVVVGQQNRVAENARSSLVSILKGLDVGNHEDGKQSSFDGVLRLVEESRQSFQGFTDLELIVQRAVVCAYNAHHARANAFFHTEACRQQGMYFLDFGDGDLLVVVRLFQNVVQSLLVVHHHLRLFSRFSGGRDVFFEQAFRVQQSIGIAFYL